MNGRNPDVEPESRSDPGAVTVTHAGARPDDATDGHDETDPLLDLFEQWDERYGRGEDIAPESLGITDPVLLAELRERIKKQKWLYEHLNPGAGPTDGAAGVDESSPSFPGHETLGKIGQGGMGVVYKARDLKLGRVVAIKTIAEAQYATREQLDRFVAEAVAVSRLQHPHIIHIHAIGEHEGRPYFSLEFAEGGSLAQRLAQGPMATAGAAELVETLARAVHTAHLAGIVHRDLKPSNVLLTADGSPKVSDFGLAKLMGSDSARTLSGDVLGTPSYMAPEQAGGHSREVGPAVDIYALGAILYQSLTGRPPFLGGSAIETLNLVMSTEVIPPRRLRPEVPRDLETICLKCLEKEPQKRYASALALAADLRRFLDGRPIDARPVTLWERSWRWCRRNPLVAGLSAAVFMILLGWITVSSALMMRAIRAEARTRVQRDVAKSEASRAREAERLAKEAEATAGKERDRAESETENAKAILEFVKKDLLAQAAANNQATPDTKPDPDLKVRTALERAAARIEGKFPGKPLVEASIRQTIGETYNDLGLYPQAQPQMERAVKLYRDALRDEDPVTLEAMNHLGLLYLAQGKLDLAETLLLKVHDRYQRVRGPEHPDTLGAANSLGQVYFTQGKPKQAESLYVQSLEGVRKALGNDRPETLEAVNNLGLLYQTQGRLAEAEPLLREAMEGLLRLHGPEHPDTLIASHNLAEVYFLRENLADAQRLFEQVLNVRSRLFGPNHPLALDTKNDLALVYEKQRRWVEAQRMRIDVLEGRRRSLGPDHRDTFKAMGNLATFYHGRNKPAEAERLLKEALAGSRRVHGERDPGTLWLMQNLGSVYIRPGKLTEAEALLSEAADGFRETLGPEHPDTLGAMNQLAMVYGAAGKPEKAEPLLSQVLEHARSGLGAEHTQTLGNMQNMAACYHRMGKFAKAEELFSQLLASRRRVPGPEDPETLTTMHMLAQCYNSEGKHDQAEPLLVEAMKGRQRVLGAKRPETLEVMDDLGVVWGNRKNFAEAEPVLRECLEIRKKTMPDGWQRYNTESLLGACLLGQKKFKEAEQLLLSAYRGLKAREESLPTIFKVRLSDAAERTIQLYEAWGKEDKADEWRKKRPSPSAAVLPKP